MTRIASGFTLIEVLVALLIVALGMLGNAMLQLQGMKNSNDAYLRSQIGLFAYDIADRIRANRECQVAYTNQGFFSLASPYIVGTSNAGACVFNSPAGNGGMGNEIACMGATLEQGLPPGSQASIFSTSHRTPAGANPELSTSLHLGLFGLTVMVKLIQWIILLIRAHALMQRHVIA